MPGGSAPYFTAPAAATTGDLCNSLSGSVSLGGGTTHVGLITAISIDVSTNAEAPKVLGQQFTPDMLLGTLNISGSVSFLLDSSEAAASLFENETKVDIMVVLTNAVTGGESITIRTRRKYHRLLAPRPHRALPPPPDRDGRAA